LLIILSFDNSLLNRSSNRCACNEGIAHKPMQKRLIKYLNFTIFILW
jgi:hypothetical protein